MNQCGATVASKAPSPAGVTAVSASKSGALTGSFSNQWWAHWLSLYFSIAR